MKSVTRKILTLIMVFEILAILTLSACSNNAAPVGSMPEPSSLETAESKPPLVVVNDDPITGAANCAITCSLRFACTRR